MAIKTFEIYDTFHPDRLLDVRFEMSETPSFQRSFRSSYASIWELVEGCQGNHLKREEHPKRNHKILPLHRVNEDRGYYFAGFEQ